MLNYTITQSVVHAIPNVFIYQSYLILSSGEPQPSLHGSVMRRAIEVAKRRFKPESISFLNRAAGERGDVEAATSGLMVEDLRDLKS